MSGWTRERLERAWEDEDRPRDPRRYVQNGTPECVCLLTPPDRDGNRDLIEVAGCPLHGVA